MHSVLPSGHGLYEVALGAGGGVTKGSSVLPSSCSASFRPEQWRARVLSPKGEPRGEGRGNPCNEGVGSQPGGGAGGWSVGGVPPPPLLHDVRLCPCLSQPGTKAH